MHHFQYVKLIIFCVHVVFTMPVELDVNKCKKAEEETLMMGTLVTILNSRWNDFN